MEWILTSITQIHVVIVKVVPTSLLARLLFNLHCLGLVVLWREWCVFNSMRREFHWPPIAKMVYTTVWVYRKRAKSKSVDKQGLLSQIYLASDPSESVAMTILGRLSKILSGVHFLQVMTAFYSNFSKAVPTSKAITSHIASSTSRRIIPCGKLMPFVPNNGTKIVCKVFESLCSSLDQEVVQLQHTVRKKWTGGTLQEGNYRQTMTLHARSLARRTFTCSCCNMRTMTLCMAQQIWRLSIWCYLNTPLVVHHLTPRWRYILSPHRPHIALYYKHDWDTV